MSHSHDGHDHGHSHSHTHDTAAAEHGHTHEIMEHPGKFTMRDMPTYENRNWKERAFTVGIGGALIYPLERMLMARLEAGS